MDNPASLASVSEFKSRDEWLCNVLESNDVPKLEEHFETRRIYSGYDFDEEIKTHLVGTSTKKWDPDTGKLVFEDEMILDEIELTKIKCTNEYHPNGKLKSEKRWLWDKKDGNFATYDMNGETMSCVHYSKGRRIG